MYVCISARVCHPGFQKYIGRNDGRISEAFFFFCNGEPFRRDSVKKLIPGNE